MAKSNIKKLYKLKDSDFKLLHYYEMDNPHYKKAGPMRCYLIAEVEEKFNKKLTSEEIQKHKKMRYAACLSGDLHSK